MNGQLHEAGFKHRPNGRPMKILHLAPHCDATGNGVVNVAIDLACTQVREGHRVLFASSGGSFSDLLDSQNIERFTFPDHRFIYFFAALWNLRRLLRTFNPDIVHAHMVPGALLVRLLRGQLPFRLVTTIHNSMRLRASLMGVGDLVITVSDATAKDMERRGIPRHKLRVVRNGPLGSPRRAVSDDVVGGEGLLRHPAIVTVAGLFSHKGISDLIEAFSFVASQNRTARLYILGDGTDRPKFEREASRKNCADRITFCGFIDDPRPYLRNSDLFVLPSHEEAFGLVLAEAREAGCAIVACNVGGIPEVLDHGSAGILVPPHQPRVLAEVMLDLLENYELRQLWRSRATTNIQWLDISRASTETLAVYRETLARGGSCFTN